MERRRLELVPVGGAPLHLLPPLARALDARFGTRAAVAAPLPLSPAWRDADTGRYRADDVLDALIARMDEGGEEAWVLGVAEVELCAPGHPTVFGVATVAGCCAVVGLGGLKDANARDETTLRRRLEKAATHELGHVAGLEHCADPRCVMYPSRDIADTDRKGMEFCGRCRTDVSAAKLDPARICD